MEGLLFLKDIQAYIKPSNLCPFLPKRFWVSFLKKLPQIHIPTIGKNILPYYKKKEKEKRECQKLNGMS